MFRSSVRVRFTLALLPVSWLLVIISVLCFTVSVGLHVDEMQVGSEPIQLDITQPDTRMESGGMESESAPSLSPPPGLEWTGGREVESLLYLSPEEAQSQLQREAMELSRERAQQNRMAAGVSSLMYRDVQVHVWVGVWYVCVYVCRWVWVV